MSLTSRAPVAQRIDNRVDFCAEPTTAISVTGMIASVQYDLVGLADILGHNSVRFALVGWVSIGGPW